MPLAGLLAPCFTQNRFIVTPPGLEEEALEMAVETEFSEVKSRVFTYEHLLAIMVKTGRPKDITRIETCLETTQPDRAILEEILLRYNLLEKWKRITS